MSTAGLRQNPIGRVGQLSRKLATKLKDHAKGYKQVPGKRVVPGIVLSHDNLQILAGRNHDISEHVWQLAAAAAEMLKIDKAETPIGHARKAVIAYLDDLPAGGKIQMLGDYRVDNRMAVPGKEQAYEAVDSADRPVVLKCYPVAALEELGNPTEFLRRETKALNKLAELGRAWQALPFFRDDAYGLFVVPVVRPPNARSLAKSLKDLDPERPGGRLPDDVARNVADRRLHRARRSPRGESRPPRAGPRPDLAGARAAGHVQRLPPGPHRRRADHRRVGTRRRQQQRLPRS